MKFELLLNVYLTWQLLLQQLVRLLGHLKAALGFCSRHGVEVGFRHHIRCELGLPGQIGRDRGTCRGGAETRSRRESYN